MARNRVTIKDHTAEANLFARRTVIAMLVIFTMIAMVLSNLYYCLLYTSDAADE